MKKYEFSGEKKTLCDGTVVHRIKSMRTFACGGVPVKTGDLGGWVESEFNLSQEGNCWIFGNGLVYAKAHVQGDAYVGGTAEVGGDVGIKGNATVLGKVDGDVLVSDHAIIGRKIELDGVMEVCGDVYMNGRISLYGVKTGAVIDKRVSLSELTDMGVFPQLVIE